MYELIQHQRLETAASSITFNNIPQTWTDLLIMVSGRSTGGNYGINATINGSTSDYGFRALEGGGNYVISFTQATSGAPLRFIGNMSHADNIANTFGNAQIYIPNYTSSAAKTISVDTVSEHNGIDTAYQNIIAALWNNTAPITSIALTPNSGNFRAGSSATLYGINRTQAIGRPKAVGGNITYANGYWVHTFTGSGSFIPSQDLDVQAIVVSGGGAGGIRHGGGGGAGGVLTQSVRLTKGSYAVTIGAGGVGGSVASGIGLSGSSSSFNGLSPLGGGAGSGGVGGNGGSGGGTGGSTSESPTPGRGTAGQGFDGGTGSGSGGESYYAGGGGGGAGGVGQSAAQSSQASGGNGGIGVIWDGSYYAGGGGGGNAAASSGSPGTGGLGGGGNGSKGTATASSATANTGGGGGGSGFNGGTNGANGSGGSGVVIIRYPAVEIRSAELAQPGVQYKIDPLTIQGAWTFATSENATYGGHTTDDYGNVGTIQSGTRKWTQYAGALQTARADANNSGMRLSSATNWTMSNEETIEMWVNPISGGRCDRLFTWGNRQDNTCTFIGRNTSTGQLDVRTNTGTASTTGYVLDGQWSWVVMSKRGSELRVFVNGIQVYYNANGDGGGYTTDGRYFTLGADWDSGYTDAPRFSGAAYWQDVIAYNAAPFHSMSTIPVPTMPLTDRII